MTRYMKKLKNYVRNVARPEGCIAENYLNDECMRFFRKYKHKETYASTEYRKEDLEDDTILEGRPLFKGNPMEFSDEMLKTVHIHVLFNIAEAEPFAT